MLSHTSQPTAPHVHVPFHMPPLARVCPGTTQASPPLCHHTGPWPPRAFFQVSKLPCWSQRDSGFSFRSADGLPKLQQSNTPQASLRSFTEPTAVSWPRYKPEGEGRAAKTRGRVSTQQQQILLATTTGTHQAGLAASPSLHTPSWAAISRWIYSSRSGSRAPPWQWHRLVQLLMAFTCVNWLHSTCLV